MKRTNSGKRLILLGCGGLLALIVVFLLWWSRNPIVFTVPEGLFAEVAARQLDSPAGDAIVVRIPATEPLAASGPLSISYEHVSTLGGHWSSSTLVLNEKTPGTV